MELVKRNINSLRQNSRQHAEQLPIYIRNNGPAVGTLSVSLSQSVCSKHRVTGSQAHTWPHSRHSMKDTPRALLWMLRFLLEQISILKFSDGSIQNFIYGNEDRMPMINPRNMKWCCWGTCGFWTLKQYSHSFHKILFSEGLITIKLSSSSYP